MGRLPRAERWFWWLVGLGAGVGAAWQLSWLVLGRPAFRGWWVAAPAALIVGVVLAVRRRDAARGAATRAARLERELWQSTLPSAEGSTRRSGPDEPAG